MTVFVEVRPPNLNRMKNHKKEAMEEYRYTEIERENRLLLEKMSSIMNHWDNRRNSTKPGATTTSPSNTF